MVAEKLGNNDEDELVSVTRELREARGQFDQASASGYVHESLQSIASFIETNEFNDAFLGPVGDEDDSRWIVMYAPTTETENSHINSPETERNNMPQSECCTIL